MYRLLYDFGYANKLEALGRKLLISLAFIICFQKFHINYIILKLIIYLTLVERIYPSSQKQPDLVGVSAMHISP